MKSPATSNRYFEDKADNTDNDAVQYLHQKMKQSSIPLSTGHRPCTDMKSTRASDLQTIIDSYTAASVTKSTSTTAIKPKLRTSMSMKNKLRYNADHVKNKQSHIPFAKFRQPNYMEYNRFGTVSNMQTMQSVKQQGSVLRQIHQDRNAQNKLYKSKLLKSSYRFGYEQTQPPPAHLA